MLRLLDDEIWHLVAKFLCPTLQTPRTSLVPEPQFERRFNVEDQVDRYPLSYTNNETY